MAQRQEDLAKFEQHDHQALVHGHQHYHVTHNFSSREGAFEHLSSMHAHGHDHAALQHNHYPHQNFDDEHAGEAHDHDHGEPVKERSPKRATAAKKSSSRARPTEA
ncbi:MAG: hypothetical protein ABR548_09345 [Actinomycetota bacterium]|nr:hypothetical protein [Actinomycetota bacterium]